MAGTKATRRKTGARHRGLYHIFWRWKRALRGPGSTLSLGSSPLSERIDEDKVVNLTACTLQEPAHWVDSKTTSACAIRIVRTASCAGCSKNERGFRFEDIPSVWRSRSRKEDEGKSLFVSVTMTKKESDRCVSPLCISQTS